MRRLLAAAIGAARAGRGRWVALSLLALLCIPLALPAYSPLQRLRLAWLDFYQVALPRQRQSEDVTIVEIDEPTLRKLGQWPWPRTRLAELIRRIGEAGASAIGLDVVMPEPDPTSPEALIARMGPYLHGVFSAFGATLTHDAQLAAAIRSHRVVLGAAGSDTAVTAEDTELHASAAVLLRGGEPGRDIRQYSHKLVSLPSFQQAASGQGIINAELERGVLRRVPLVSIVEGTLVPTLSLELVRTAIGASNVVVDVSARAIGSVSVGNLRVPTQPSGEMWIHFSRQLAGRYVSALEVFQGDLQSKTLQDKLRDKIVIIGITGLALVDKRVTPLGETVSGTDVHAQMIESFFERRFLQRPPWLAQAEVGGLIALGGLLIWVTPGMRRHYSIMFFLAVLMLLAALGFSLFVWSGLLLDAASLAVALLAIFSSLVIGALAQADHDRRTSLRSLRAAREAAARVAGELEAARRIQLGTLPNSATSFPLERRFQLAAAIEPARVVGGDLYDFFMLDANRLFFHIADVSGKGIPASLFMSIAKALTKSIALRSSSDATDLLTQANVEISRDNPESLFVTAFAAILDATSGEVRYWTAGHDTPFLYDGREARQLDRSQSGPPLCVLETFEYPQQRCWLRPGELLVLFTDGIPEAENPGGAMYGKDRLARCLGTLASDVSAAGALEAILNDVSAFVSGAPASDDVTLLVLRWRGPDAVLSAP